MSNPLTPRSSPFQIKPLLSRNIFSIMVGMIGRLLAPIKGTAILTLLIFAVTSTASASNSCQSLLLPHIDRLVSVKSESSASAISGTRIRLLSWNIQKAQDAELGPDLRRLGNESDLILLQEAVNGPHFVNQLEWFQSALDWTMSVSFQRKSGDFTGVMTGSKTHTVREEALVSEVVEPLSKTPKTILLSQYAIENSEESLLVANVHAINFVSQKTFETQMNQLFSKILSHKGPLIIAGDFNTWNSFRKTYLQDNLGRLGITPVPYQRKSMLNLDHIFIRGLRIGSVIQRSDIKSSDHYPISAELFLEPSI